MIPKACAMPPFPLVHQIAGDLQDQVRDEANGGQKQQVVGDVERVETGDQGTRQRDPQNDFRKFRKILCAYPSDPFDDVADHDDQYQRCGFCCYFPHYVPPARVFPSIITKKVPLHPLLSHFVIALRNFSK